jgi:hypothetical protein
MHITISDKPNALGSYRYDVSAAGRSNFGFRPSATEARRAAQEDGKLLYLAGFSDRQEDAAPDSKLPKRLRRKEEE